MARIQMLDPDDLQKYHLPIGLLGFINQLANFYVLLSFTCARRPLWPWRPIQHQGYSTFICCVVMILVIGFDADSISHLDHWELITSVVGNMVLLISFIGIALGGCHSQTSQVAAAGPQANAVESPQSIGLNERRETGYSRDLERCDIVLDDKGNTLDISKSGSSESKILGVPENPANRTSTKDVDAMGSLSTSTTIREEPTELPPPRKAPDTDTGAALYMLIFNMPGTILVFVGLVGHLARDLPADWRGISQLRSIVITFSIFLVGTVLCIIASALRAVMREEEASDELVPKKSHTWKDSVFLGSIILSFFVVSFDKWLLAALTGDINGTKHILSGGGLPLVYMILTKLPALAL